MDLKVGKIRSPSKLHKFLENLIQKVLPYKSSWDFLAWRIFVNSGQYLGRPRSIKCSYIHSKILQHRYQHPEKIQMQINQFILNYFFRFDFTLIYIKFHIYIFPRTIFSYIKAELLQVGIFFPHSIFFPGNFDW